MAIDVELTLSDKATRLYNQFVGNVNKQAATMDNTMKSIGTAVGAAFSIGAVASFMKTAADANLQLAKMDQMLANSGMSEYKDELLAASDALSEKTAVDGDEIVKLQAQLVGYTGNINAVRQLTPAILDLAAGTGMSVEAAGKLVARSHEGAEGLKRLGIEIGETVTEEERLEKITKAVTERYGGMAEAFGNTDAGGLQKMANTMEDLQETVGNVFLRILKPVLPGILSTFEAIGWVIEKTVGTIRVLTTAIMTGLVAPLAAVENQLNIMGVTSSRTFQTMMESGMRQTGEAFDELIGKTDAAEKATGKLGATNRATEIETVTLRDSIKNLQTELNTLTPGTLAYETVLRRLNIEQREWNRLVEQSNVAIQTNQAAIGNLTKSMQTDIIPKARMDAFRNFFKNTKLDMIEVKDDASTYLDEASADSKKQLENWQNGMAIGVNSMVVGFEAAFSGAQGAGNTFLKSILIGTIDMVQGMIIAAESAALAKSTISWGATLVKDLPMLVAATAGLQGARFIASKFHDGGTMGYDGNRIPLKSDERPAILKVGETVRTKEQEASLNGSSSTSTVNININGQGLSIADVKRAVEEGMRQTGLIVEQYFVNPNFGMRQQRIGAIYYQ